jgi:predicted ATPase/DNA-binding XRE family transcriptional regulator
MTKDPKRDASRGHDAPFGTLLRRLREDSGLTQEELAARAGLSAKGISDLERGARRRPHPHTVRSLADALELSEDERASLLATVPKRGDLADNAPILIESALPAPPAPLVGRERDLEEVTGFLRRQEVRLLTLTGTGGVGKTRLALEAARHAGVFFPDGVAFIALAPLNDAGLVIPTVARSLGLKEASGQTPREALREHLRDKRMLLVLDNFEHVLQAAPVIAELLEFCPNLKVIVTSRAPLLVRGEQEYPVPPLELPSSTLSPAPEEVAGSPSGRLFLERARAASPAFELTRENAVAVAAICWRLAGLPLALELAAVRTRFLDPAALLTRLDQALSAGWTRDLPQRQQTISATLDWSYDLLSDPMRVLFRRLSVFVGGFSLEAAEALSANEGDVLDRLGRLVEQSLVRVEPNGAKARYGMLEPVRQYALERLRESDEEEQTRARHAAFFLTLTERAAPELWRPDQVGWMDLLETENDNLRAALSWTVERGHDEAGLRLSVALRRFWSVRGYLEEGRRWLETALSACPSPEPSVQARALHGIGSMALEQGDRTLADRVLRESLALRRGLNDKGGIAASLQGLAEVALWARDYGRAATLCAESVALRREIDDEQGLTTALNISGLVETLRGDYERAVALHEEGLTVARRAGDTWAIAVHLDNLGWATLGRGDRERAARLFREALKLNSELGEKWLSADCLDGLARVASLQSSPVRAARLWGAAKTSSETIGALAAPLDQSAYDRHVAAARAQLDEGAFDAAWAEGRSMTYERAVAYALADDDKTLSATP